MPAWWVITSGMLWKCLCIYMYVNEITHEVHERVTSTGHCYRAMDWLQCTMCFVMYDMVTAVRSGWWTFACMALGGKSGAWIFGLCSHRCRPLNTQHCNRVYVSPSACIILPTSLTFLIPLISLFPYDLLLPCLFLYTVLSLSVYSQMTKNKSQSWHWIRFKRCVFQLLSVVSESTVVLSM